MTESDFPEFDRKALLAVFLAEAEERVGQMEESLVALEARPNDDELLQGIFRAAHTLKGNAATLGFAALTDFTHALEDLLERVRSRSLAATPSLVTLLLECVDALRRLLADAASGVDTLRAADRSLLARIAAARTRDVSEAAIDVATGHPMRREEDRATEVPDLNLATRTLRVDVERLDQMLDLVGEIAVARGRSRSTARRTGSRPSSRSS